MSKFLDKVPTPKLWQELLMKLEYAIVPMSMLDKYDSKDVKILILDVICAGLGGKNISKMLQF